MVSENIAMADPSASWLYWVITLLWDNYPLIIKIALAIYIIKFIAGYFTPEFKDLPTLNVKIPDIKGGQLQSPVKVPAEEIINYSPTTMEVLGVAKVFTKEDVQKTVMKAREAQKTWAKTTFAERRRVLRTLQQFVIANQADINFVSTKETGKTKMEAAFGEVLVTCEKIKYLCDRGEQILAREYRAPGIMMHKSAYIDYVPYGVIGLIIPWNFPIHNALSHISTALFTGNAVVVKVSEWASWSHIYLESIFKELLRSTGHSEDLVKFVTGYGETGTTLVTSVNKVLFIGSPGVGKKVMEVASKTLTPVTLELGGKDPFIVCEDADIEYTVGIGMRGAFFNCGQNCMSAERFYVFEGIYEKFLAKVKEITLAMKQGPDASDIGAINMPYQVARYEEYLNDAVSKGAKILMGGKVNTTHKGHFFEPTILVDVNHSMKIMKEEMFGPVMCVMKVKSDEEVIQLANDAEYGLSSSIFSANYKRAHAIAEQLESGGTVINDWGLAFMCADLPFGGVKVSGFGKFNGPEGLKDFCTQRTCVTDKFGIVVPPPKAVLNYPTSARAHKLVEDAITMMYVVSPLKKISALLSLGKKVITKDF